jgi:transcriptional regulator with XRE-family HTH domain
MGDHHNPELRRFLRSRRACIAPEDVGLSSDGTRRVPGLRREEVAQLAGVSVDYYVRLERGRKPTASEAVLNALARALRLDDIERDHLFTIARPARRPAMPTQQVRPELQRILDGMTHLPAMILGRRLDILATNDMARALYTDFDARPPRDRNMARYVFLDENARSLYTDWERGARMVLATLHLYAGRWPDDPRLIELVDDLSAHSNDFNTWWAANDVARQTHGSKGLHHPVVGDLTLSFETFTATDDPEQLLGIYTAEPGSPSERALNLLARLGAEPHNGHDPVVPT